MKTFIRLLWSGVILVFTCAAGCAHAPAVGGRDAAPLYRDALFKPPAKPVDTAAIFALDDAMRRFLADEVFPQTRHRDPARVLLDTLNGKGRINYDTEMTRTAAQTFAAREGNCLSLVLMTAAFAKQLGIPVVYQEVFGFDTWSRDPGFDVLSQHVNLVLGSRVPRRGPNADADAAPLVVDFVPPRQAASAVSRPIPEAVIVAMYLNNRAAEVMTAGDLDDAYWLARAALATDPSSAIAANTLGVIYTARGLPEAAEQALRYALAREPDNAPALSNLLHMLEAQGRGGEAQVVKAKLADVQRHPPFYFFDRGTKALNAGDYKTAAELFEKSLAQRPYDDQSHFGLAVAALHLGDAKRARKQLELAVESTTTRESRAIYAAKLQHLRSHAPTGSRLPDSILRRAGGSSGASLF